MLLIMNASDDAIIASSRAPHLESGEQDDLSRLGLPAAKDLPEGKEGVLAAAPEQDVRVHRAINAAVENRRVLDALGTLLLGDVLMVIWAMSAPASTAFPPLPEAHLCENSIPCLGVYVVGLARFACRSMHSWPGVFDVFRAGASACAPRTLCVGYSLHCLKCPVISRLFSPHPSGAGPSSARFDAHDKSDSLHHSQQHLPPGSRSSAGGVLWVYSYYWCTVYNAFGGCEDLN